MGHGTVEPPARLRRELERAITSGQKVVIAGISLTPPTPTLNRWRVQVHHQGRRFDRTYGPGVANAYKGYLQADAWVIQQKAGHIGRPEFESAWHIAIPRDAPAGFSLADWLPARIADACVEQTRGWNPKALIFPSLSGGVFGEQNLRNRVWAPAADELGWLMESPGGTNRRLLRFTLHSLRDRYANTALHLWKYTEEVLLQQGSWKDPETVRRFYAGITDQTLTQALAIHGWGPIDK